MVATVSDRGEPALEATVAVSPGGTPTSPAPATTTIGKYRLDRILGSGGMGVVWAAFDPDLERKVAIKLLHDTGDATLRARLLREARAMARIKHPNVLTVYEVDTDANRDFIVMEIVEGTTLAQWLATRPPRAAVIEALLAAGRGLVAAHDGGLVHRDFKPSNILRDTSGHICVTDFGLARGSVDAEGELVVSGAGATPTNDSLDAPLTQTGIVIGTPAYMAPEQFAGRIPDARTDQFAFCVTAWEALAGARPFVGATLPELEQAVNAGPTHLIGDLPAPVRKVLARGLAPDPDARWPDLRSALAALAASSAPRRSRRAVAYGALAVAVTGSLGGAMWAATRSSSSPPSSTGSAAERCVPGDQAFATAWTPERASALSNDEQGLGLAIVLQQVRSEWIELYDAVCAAPQNTETARQLTCLRRVRDEVARETAGDLTKGSALVAIAQLMGSVSRCVPDAKPKRGKLDIDVPAIPEPSIEWEAPESPASPAPPAPPTPPSPPR